MSEKVSHCWWTLKFTKFCSTVIDPLLNEIQLKFCAKPYNQTCITMYNIFTILSLWLHVIITFWILQVLWLSFYRWDGQIYNFLVH